MSSHSPCDSNIFGMKHKLQSLVNLVKVMLYNLMLKMVAGKDHKMVPLTDWLRKLKRLMSDRVLRDLYEKMPEEDRKRFNSGNFSNGGMKFQDTVFNQVNDKVREEFDDIIELSYIDQFFKGCELSGFPVEICYQGSYKSRIVSMICYQMNKSNELRFTDLASPNFISLLRDYEVLGSIFDLSGVGLVLHELKLRSDTLDMVNQLMRKNALNLADIFDSILQVGSFEFNLLQAQAILHVALTEEDPVKLQSILTGFYMRLQQQQLYPNQKREYLIKVVLLLSNVLDTHAWKASSPGMMVHNFRTIWTILYAFAKDIALPISAQQYGDMLELEQKFFETTIRGNPQQKDLSQKLEESLSGANPMH